MDRQPLKTHGLTLDYSHHLLTQDDFNELSTLCEQMDLHEKMQCMMTGHIVNITENRPALHTALRDASPQPIMVSNHNIKQEIRAARFLAQELIETLSQRPITDVVHIGMGGSHWGIQCAYQALSHLPAKYRVHFVSTIDPDEITSVLSQLHGENTLFILASKSFSTQEMFFNASMAKAWLKNQHVKQINQHFVAITEKQDLAQEWGVPSDQILPMWEWVGGRFSVWSLISLPIIMSYGFDVFDAFLMGGHEMDQHLLEAEYLSNMPVLLAIIDYWYRVKMGYNTLAIIPYEFALRTLVPHLQQLHMESLGKPGKNMTGGIVWGALGSHAQHTFNQLLQQGTEIVPIDFILSESACRKTPDLKRQCLAQRTSLFHGHAASDSHAILEGKRPSNLILLESLAPQCLGNLFALYEHKVTILAMLYGVNAFDHFGVEYSKWLAR